MIDRALKNELKNPVYAYLAPYYSQAERVAWQYFKDYTQPIRGAKPNEQKLRIVIPRPERGDRITINLLGADNPKSLRGIYLDGAVLDEFGEMNPTVYTQVIRPTLSDRKGWAIFIGTPRGENHFTKMFKLACNQMAAGNPDWYAAIYKASETGLIDPDELNEARISMDEDEYEQEYECSFTAAIKGSYYGTQMSQAYKDGRIGKVPFDPGVEVDTYWDIGLNDSSAIWFVQRVGARRNVIRYWEGNNKSIPELAGVLKEARDHYGYYYGVNWLPHDGRKRDIGSKKSVEDQFKEQKVGGRWKIAPKLPINDGIQGVRRVLPLCYFDEVNCEQGIFCLQNYQREWDAANQVFVNTPKHDWASHGADAFRTFGVADRERIDVSSLQRQADNDYDVLGGV